MPSQVISAARPGIGIIKFVLNVHPDGLSTQETFVFQFLTIVNNGLLQEPVHHATKDTNCQTDNAFCLLPFNQLIWDARPGIGTDKFVLNAQPDGPSTQRASVFQFLTTVPLMMLQEPVFHVSRDTN